MDERRNGPIVRWLLRRGWRRVDDLTLRDLAAVGYRHGIRFIPRVVPLDFEERPTVSLAPVDGVGWWVVVRELDWRGRYSWTAKLHRIGHRP